MVAWADPLCFPLNRKICKGLILAVILVGPHCPEVFFASWQGAAHGRALGFLNTL